MNQFVHGVIDELCNLSNYSTLLSPMFSVIMYIVAYGNYVHMTMNWVVHGVIYELCSPSDYGSLRMTRPPPDGELTHQVPGQLSL